MRFRLLHPSVLLLCMLLCGCVRFQPKPLSLTNTADDFDSRSLEDQGLGRFLSANSVEWPRKEWDLKALTLAAFYYQPDLDMARAHWSAAQGALVTAGMRPNPSVSATPTYDTTTAPPWILGLSFDIPLETAGKRGRRMEQARHLAQAARLTLAQTAWQVRSRVRRTMLDLYAATQTESALKEQLAAQTKVAGFLEQQLEQGAISRFELSQTRIAVNTTRLALQDAQRTSAEARAALADAIGVPGAAIEGIAVSFEGLEDFPVELNTADARRKAALNRTDILAVLAEYAASQSALQLEIAKQYPDLHIGPGYQLDQTDNKWTLGATLTLPVLNQNQGGIAEAKAHREETAARLLSVQSKALGQVDRAIAGYKIAREQVATADTLLRELKERRAATERMVQAGELDPLSLANAEVEFSAGVLARLNAITKTQQALVALEDALQSPLLLPAPPGSWERNPREGGWIK